MNEAAAAGLKREDLAAPANNDFVRDGYVLVWPDNWTAVSTFAALGTQWRVGVGGATGLDYTAIPVVLELRGVPREQWPEIFEDLRVLERSALRARYGEDDD